MDLKELNDTDLVALVEAFRALANHKNKPASETAMTHGPFRRLSHYQTRHRNEWR
jgi:hypothetical protein